VAFLPFDLVPTHAAASALGRALDRIEVLALCAALRHRCSLVAARQQIASSDRHLAFSTRITAQGDLVMEMDPGDPRLPRQPVLEDELRRASRAAKETATRPRACAAADTRAASAGPSVS
jgi:hypothetical protein